jgi:hypothetical protein
MPKASRTPSAAQQRRHNPLSEEYAPSELKQKTNKKRKSEDVPNKEDGFVNSKASRNILQLGQDLAAEDEAEQEANRPAQPNPAFAFESRFPLEGEDDEEEGGAEVGEYDDEEAWGSDDEVVEEIEIDPEDLAAWDKYNPSFDPSTLLDPKNDSQAAGPGTNLADLILEKIAAHEAGAPPTDPRDIQGGGDPDDAVELPAKVVEVYTQIGMLLSRYKSGKLPKPFKILPTLPQWDILLSITRPDSWTANATYEATKLFISSRPALAQAFCCDVLLPKVREDIRESTLQACRFLPRSLIPSCRWRTLHTSRSTDRWLSAGKGQYSRIALSHCTVQAMRDGRRADVVRRRKRRRVQYLHPHTAREEVRSALPCHRRAGLPLPALPRRARRRSDGRRVRRELQQERCSGPGLACAVASVSVGFRAEVQERDYGGSKRGVA